MISFYNDNLDYNHLIWQEKEEEQNYFYSEGEDNKILFQNYNESITGEENNLANIECEPPLINPKISSILLEPQNFNTGKTEPTSIDLIKKKRNREDKYDEDEENVQIKEGQIGQKEETPLQREARIEGRIKPKNTIKTVLNVGRRKKNEIYQEEPGHDKFKQDNIMRKIKTFVFKFILEILNNSLKENETSNKFYPLNTELTENLKKDFNEELLERTIYDIYMSSNLNERYKNVNEPNKKLIEKIFKEQKESETINILQMTLKDILNIIREKELNYFLDKIREIERKNKNVYIDLYMKHVENLLMNYEDWFKNKLGRNVNKKKKQKKCLNIF